jgi:tetratricopeptide (TPR) repeat protein
LNVRAGVYEALGKWNEAAADYRGMIERAPKEREAYVCLARIYEKQGQRAKAAECFDRFIAEAKEPEWAFVRRAEYRRDCGDFEAALADCGQAAKIAPNWAVPALVRAGIGASRGEPAVAVAQAEHVLEKASLDDGHILFAAACVWSLAAGAAKDSVQSKQYAERAADLLARTLDKGFHDLNYPEHNRMANEAALAPIQHLPMVQKLLKGSGPVETEK